MQLLASRPELKHFSGDRDVTSAWHERERFYGRSQRLRTGIVAIVDDANVAELENLPSLVACFKIWESSGDLRKRNTPLDRDCGSRKHVIDIMTPEQGTNHWGPRTLNYQVETSSTGAQQFDILCANIGCRRVYSKENYVTIEISPKLRNVLIVRIQKRCSASRK
jgi:hypothetical protein